jgi:hypothetical protein
MMLKGYPLEGVWKDIRRHRSPHHEIEDETIESEPI